jgi:hypothetical protein
MHEDREAARQHAIEFAAAAVTRQDWAAAEAWCAIAWMMSREEAAPE